MRGQCAGGEWAACEQCVGNVWAMRGQCVGNAWQRVGNAWAMCGQCVGNEWAQTPQTCVRVGVSVLARASGLQLEPSLAPLEVQFALAATPLAVQSALATTQRLHGSGASM